MIFNNYELFINKNISLIYLFDRVLNFNYLTIVNNKILYNKKIYILNNLFVIFLNNLKIFFLFNNKFVNIINSYFSNLKKILFNKNNDNYLESSNLFCKFYYLKLYNKLIIKFSKYDIKIILFKNYGFNNSIINNKNFLIVNNKFNKITIINDYLNNFSSRIKNIKKYNVYTGKGIKYPNEILNIKIYKKNR